MIVERVEHPEWLSNAYLVADGGHGVLVDGNGLRDELERRAADEGIEITHVLCTHGHGDHVDGLERDREAASARRSSRTRHAHRRGRAGRRRRDLPLGPDSRSARSTPRATAATTSRSSSAGTHCLTADVLFQGTVGGTARAGGRPRRAEALDPRRAARARPRDGRPPGPPRGDDDRRGAAANPFIRAWLDGEGLSEEPCRVAGEEATLLLWAPDYDGGNKALVRFPDGRETIVGGSRVSRG